MLDIIANILKIISELIKNPKLFKIIKNISIIVVLIYCLYHIENIKKNTNNVSNINDLDDTIYTEFYNSVIDDSDYSQIIARNLSMLCDNNSPGSCVSSYWHINKESDNYIQLRNYFVVRCVLKYKGIDFYCGRDLSDKYIKTLKYLDLPKQLITSIKNTNSSCVSGEWDNIKNMKGANLGIYEDAIDTTIGNISMCTHNEKVILLTQELGHNPVRTSNNENKGCIDKYCLYETMDTMSQYKKIRPTIDER